MAWPKRRERECDQRSLDRWVQARPSSRGQCQSSRSDPGVRRRDRARTRFDLQAELELELASHEAQLSRVFSIRQASAAMQG
eukprot:6186144-Pleurochrysis_carterae.AAC.3